MRREFLARLNHIQFGHWFEQLVRSHCISYRFVAHCMGIRFMCAWSVVAGIRGACIPCHAVVAAARNTFAFVWGFFCWRLGHDAVAARTWVRQRVFIHLRVRANVVYTSRISFIHFSRISLMAPFTHHSNAPPWTSLQGHHLIFLHGFIMNPFMPLRITYPANYLTCLAHWDIGRITYTGTIWL